MKNFETLFKNAKYMHRAIAIDKKSHPKEGLMLFRGFIPAIITENRISESENFHFDEKWRFYACQTSPVPFLKYLKRHAASLRGFQKKFAEYFLNDAENKVHDKLAVVRTSDDIDLSIDILCGKELAENCFCVGMEICKERNDSMAQINLFFKKFFDNEPFIIHAGLLDIGQIMKTPCDFSVFTEEFD